MAPPSLPSATIRTQVPLPLRFGDGYAATARVFSFDGLVDGHEHLAFGLGDRASPLSSSGPRPVPLVRPHSECLTAMCSAASGATAGRSCEKLSSASPTHTLDVPLSAG
jgi:GTP cyclohydrolase II